MHITAGGLIDSQASAPASAPSPLPVPRKSTADKDDKDEEEEADDMLLEMLAADQSGMDSREANGNNNSNSGDNKDSAESDSNSAQDDGEYNVYDALRKEERSRNSLMRFRIQK